MVLSIPRTPPPHRVLPAYVEVEHHVLPDSTHAFLNRPNDHQFDTATWIIAKWIAAATVREGIAR